MPPDSGECNSPWEVTPLQLRSTTLPAAPVEQPSSVLNTGMVRWAPAATMKVAGATLLVQNQGTNTSLSIIDDGRDIIDV